MKVLRLGRFRNLAAPVSLTELGVLHERLALATLGFAMTFPAYLLPGQPSSPRLSDLALVLALPLVVTRWRRLGTGPQTAMLGAVLLLALTPVMQMLQLGQRPNAPDVVFWLRWVMAAAAAMPVAALIAASRERRRLFLLCLGAGALGHLGTYALLEVLGRGGLEAAGLASPRVAHTSVAAHVRITTLAEHPNAAMGMVGLGAAACLCAPARAGERMALQGLAAGMILTGFACTLSRGGTAAAGLAALAAMLIGMRRPEGRNPLPLMLAACLLSGGALVAQLGGVALDGARFAARFDLQMLQENLAGRAETWTRGLLFVSRHPLGVGWSSAEELGLFRALTVSHNGYLFMARTVGLAAAVMTLALHLISALKTDALAPLAVFVLAMMFSEDLTQGAGFVFAACLTAALAFRRPVA